MSITGRRLPDTPFSELPLPLDELQPGDIWKYVGKDGQPAQLSTDQVVQGFKAGVVGRKVGDTVLISIPAEYGYGTEASEGNERCTVSLEGETARVAVKQIAGVVARRIVCRVQPGDALQAGERFGLIRFGSRTDLIVPRSTTMKVTVGDRVRGGESVMGVLR